MDRGRKEGSSAVVGGLNVIKDRQTVSFSFFLLSLPFVVQPHLEMCNEKNTSFDIMLQEVKLNQLHNATTNGICFIES